VRRVARKARRLGRKALRRGRRRLLRGYYRIQLRSPVEPDLAVFAAYWYRGYSCNPKAVYEKLREAVPSVRGVWVVEKEHEGSIPAGVEHVVAWTRDYYRLIARAKYFVNNVNFPNELVKREGTIHVQTHHGTPLKTMGLDLRSAYFAGRRMKFDRLLERVGRWDYSVSSNSFSTEIWKRVYPGRYETLEVGYPRNDVLANATPADVARARRELGIAPGQRSVLFAPTHREYLGEYVPTADLARLARELGPEYVILARLHYFYREGVPAEPGIVDVTRHPSIEDLYLAADVLVTDYSSIMFDYAVLDRPIVIHAPDWATYQEKRGTYFDLLAEPPGVVTTSDEELAVAFRSGAAWSDEAARLRAAFRARFSSLDDGRAAERVVRQVWGGEAAGDRETVDAAAAKVEA
jgi:CDP-glycerol glycerophosphotransferase